ncbi:UNVERIFIED_CONTAM: Oligouridylate-binding protein 1B [Sesamum radiatum]|uniref:Oligouridylate-binding protein 1B n=1 Tax=Sesamum radiatum TaxID=300843 RepID=A0AAW2PDU8_SESRA
MQNQRLKQQQHQALMQQALLQQQSLYHPGLLAAPQVFGWLVGCGLGFPRLKTFPFNAINDFPLIRLVCLMHENPKSLKDQSSIEPIPSGNLPPGFDPSTCRSVYVGNIHTQVTEPLLQEVFASTGPVEACKLIRKEKSSYGFIHYFDRRSAALAILTLNGRHLFGQPIKVNWAYASGQREDTSSHYNIFVGDLSPEVTDAMLFAAFSVYASCSGFGFVSFRNQQDAQSAINDLTGKWLGSRQIRCNWATKGAGTNDDKQSSDSKSVVELTNGSSETSSSTEDVKEAASSDAPENNPQYTTVYVGNLAPEVTQVDLHRHFHALGAGSIEEVRVQRDKGFGFVRYSTHAEAAMAISMGNTQSFLCGKQLRAKPKMMCMSCICPMRVDSTCSWGNKPTPPGTSSNPLPPPAPAALPGLSAADLLAYERQLAMSKMGGVHALMHPQGQHALKASMGMGAGASQAIYDGGFQSVAAAQQLMYYQ